MFKLESTIIVNRPVEEVAAFVADFENAPKWQNGVVQSRSMSAGPLQVGTTFEEDVRVMGRHVPTVCVLTSLNLPHDFEFESKSSGLVQYQARFIFTPVDGGTRVDLTGKAQLLGLWRLVEPMFARETKTELVGEMQAIKRALETSAAAVGSA